MNWLFNGACFKARTAVYFLDLQVKNGFSVGTWCLGKPKQHRFMARRMPGMNGLEATRLSRAKQRAGEIPRTVIVALTANAMQEDRGLAAGMDDFLAKQIDQIAACDGFAMALTPLLDGIDKALV